MKNFLFTVLFCLVCLADYAQAFNQNADPACIRIINESPLPLRRNTTLIYRVGNGGTDPIPAGTVEWTLNLDEMKMGVSAADPTIPPGFIMYSRTEFNRTTIMTFRTTVPLQPKDTSFDIRINVQGINPGTTILSINVRRLPGKSSQVGDIDGSNTNNSSPITFTSRVLPITWASFEASKIDKGVILDWKTASEQNTSHFIAERSPDAIHFDSIGYVRAAGNSAIIRSYFFTDKQPMAGINYYRLKQVDIDGRYSYSVIRNVTIKVNKAALVIYPNPASGIVHIAAINNTIELFDLTGKRVQKYLNAPVILNMDISKLAAGLYIVRATDIHGAATTGKLQISQ